MDMFIILEVIGLILGFVFLIKGSDIFVDGASSIALLLKVPTVIVGLTVVAFGTSAPEAAVSITSSITGSNAMAVSNVIGSNIFNLLMVVGIAALLNELLMEEDVLKSDLPFLTIMTGVLTLVIFFFSGIPSIIGIGLLIVLIAYIFKLIRTAGESGSTHDVEKPKYDLKWSIVAAICGLAAIVIGGELVVYCASDIAIALGMSETLVGLTIVAIGTSLPELATSLTALNKGETDLVIGNVIGSNIFNILFVLGASSAISAISLDSSILIDTFLLLLFTVIFYIFGKSDQKFSKREGAFLVICFIGYMAYAISMNYLF